MFYICVDTIPIRRHNDYREAVDEARRHAHDMARTKGLGWRVRSIHERSYRVYGPAGPIGLDAVDVEVQNAQAVEDRVADYQQDIDRCRAEMEMWQGYQRAIVDALRTINADQETP